MPSGLFYLKSLDKSISYIRDGWLVFGLRAHGIIAGRKIRYACIDNVCDKKLYRFWSSFRHITPLYLMEIVTKAIKPYTY